MEIRRLEFETVEEIYHNHLVFDFIEAEQKPLDFMKRLYEKGLYECFGLYDQGEFRGYAFFCKSSDDSTSVLLDYYVVVNGHRGQGTGSRFMDLLKQEYKDYDQIIGEVEVVDPKLDAKEYEIRKRRQNFYFKNQWVMTELDVTLFGEELNIYQLPIRKKAEDEVIYQKLNHIYDVLFCEPEVRKQVNLRHK